MFGCQSCGSREPLHIGVTSVVANEVDTDGMGVATDPSPAVPRDSRAPGVADQFSI
jgi:hypothetical protein